MYTLKTLTLARKHGTSIYSPIATIKSEKGEIQNES